ncbi:MAG TPA: hypothetical protein VF222_06400 [Nitrososphaeraceae archaeon]
MTNNNDKDIKIVTGEDVGKDDKIKAGVNSLAKKPFRETSAEYKADSLE